jgi:hypothetical protein
MKEYTVSVTKTFHTKVTVVSENARAAARLASEVETGTEFTMFSVRNEEDSGLTVCGIFSEKQLKEWEEMDEEERRIADYFITGGWA